MTTDALFREKVPALMARLMADFDLTAEDAAAVFGNAGHESAGFRILQEIKPTVVGSRGGYGLFQWTGPRRRNFESYCARNRLKPSDLDANYAFLFVELTGSEAAAIPALRKASTLRDKVIAFEQAFERAGVKHYDSRVIWAQKALAAYRASETRPEGLPSAPPLAPAATENAPAIPAAPAGSGWLSSILSALRWR